MVKRNILKKVGIVIITLALIGALVIVVQRQREISQFSFLVEQAKTIKELNNDINVAGNESDKIRKKSESVKKREQNYWNAYNAANKKINDISDTLQIGENEPGAPGWTYYKAGGVRWNDYNSYFYEVVPTEVKDAFMRNKPKLDKLYAERESAKQQAELLDKQVESINKQADNLFTKRLNNIASQNILVKSRINDQFVSRDLYTLKKNLLVVADLAYEVVVYNSEDKNSDYEWPFSQKKTNEMIASSVRVDEEIEQFCNKWRLNVDNYKVKYDFK